ncbi:hypothetical protein [Lacrimispora amygdalina]|uniref:hypothetical protein n=1 Tax=Lacrimispora amygdalina TaxID=253257 RepID=UPI000BE36E61|nr:hypothetical protein [Lacrimispora amygdalina]
MKVFPLGKGKVVYNDDAESCLLCVNYFQDHAVTAKEKFVKAMENCKSIEEVLTQAPIYGQKCIDEEIERGIDLLVKAKIYEYSVARLKADFDNLIYENTSEYRELLKRYSELKEAKGQYDALKKLERDNRSKWQGGGFGIGGAIKGSLKAGAMNAATGMVRGVGDTFTDIMDNAKFENEKNALNNAQNLESLADIVLITVGNVLPACILGIFEKHLGTDTSSVIDCDYDKVDSILANIEKIDSWDETYELIRQIIETTPLADEAWVFLLNNYSSMEVDFHEVKELTQFVCPKQFAWWAFAEMNFIMEASYHQKISAKNGYDIVKEKAIAYDYMDENGILLPHENQYSNAMSLYTVIALSCLEIRIRYKDEQGILHLISDAASEKLEEMKESITLICNQYHVLDASNSWAIAGKFDRCQQMDFYKELSSLLSLLKKGYEKACVVEKRSFQTLAEANRYRAELKSFQDIYIPGTDYADYESGKLSEKIVHLDGIEFYDDEIKQKVLDLKEKQERLKEYENTEVFRRGERLKTSFQKYEVPNLFVYGSNLFLEQASLAIKNKNILLVEKEPYIIAVYNEAAKGKMKGIVITEQFIYNLTNVISLSNSSIELEKILAVKVVNGTILEVTLKDKKQIKWKLSGGMPLNEIVEGLTKGLSLSPDMNVPEANVLIKILEGSQTPKAVRLETNHRTSDAEKQRGAMWKQELMAIILSGITIATMIIVPLIAVSMLLVIPSFIMCLIAWKSRPLHKKLIIAFTITDGLILLLYAGSLVLAFFE